jgi:carboxylate-amine ligase
VRIDFHGSPEPTLGVEWEFALVDKKSRDLSNTASELFRRAKPRLDNPARLHKELLRNTVEVVTGINHTVGEAVAELRDTLETIVPVADELGIDLYGGGTHPFASWTRSSSPRATVRGADQPHPVVGDARC